MNKIDLDCRLAYQVNQPTEFIFQILAAKHPSQSILTEDLKVRGGTPIFFENHQGANRFFRFSCAENECEIQYQAIVDVNMPERNPLARELSITELPSDLLHYLLPSRYCESDLMSATAKRTFGHLSPGFNRVEAICDWIKHNIEYEVGSSQPSTTARDVLCNRAGVCRDFAHLGITFCRALNIPARFVVGYAEFPDPPADFHALFEAYIGGGWMLFDPTKMVPLEKIVRIGVGNDAKDVAFATFYGNAQMRYLNPLVRDHIHGPWVAFTQTDEYIGSTRPVRMN